MRQISTFALAGCCAALLAVGPSHAASLSKADHQFLMEAANGDMTEAHEGQMAQERGARSDVKDFGKALEQDHTKNYEELTELAAKVGVSIPKGIDSAKNTTIRQLAGEHGARFDASFARDEVTAHRQAIAVFQREAKHGENADVKAFAAKTIPVLEHHLQLAEACARAERHS